METINYINRENFKYAFSLIDILTGSAFYPASGIDAADIKCLSPLTNSFVHVDYSSPRDYVESRMIRDFKSAGYELIGIKEITQNELSPKGFRPSKYPLNSHEKRRLEMEFVRDRFFSVNFTPFALWAVYELNPEMTDRRKDKISRFSLLHIGGEACAALESLYLGNKINPFAVTIILPGEGYGDNWTIFRDTRFRLYQTLLHNHTYNKAPMPPYLLTNMQSPETPCFWPEYQYHKTIHSNSMLHLFKRE